MNIQKKIKIIAEVAQGYEGSFNLAKKMIDGSIYAAADGVKFQLIYADEICTKRYPYYKFFKSLELNVEKWHKLIEKKRKKIEIYFDIYGKKSLKVAKELKADGVKISSTDVLNDKLIYDAVKSFKKVFIAISGLEINKIRKILSPLKNYKKKIILLYGIQSEPTSINDNNFLKLKKLIKIFSSFDFGVMEHTDGDDKLSKYLPLIPLAYGIKYIEKHITIDRKLRLEDYISALSISDFKEFCEVMRTCHKSLGSNQIIISNKEKKYKQLTSKVLVAQKNIKIGTKLSEKNIILKRDKLKSNAKNLFSLKDIKNKKIVTNKIKDDPILISDI